VGLVWSADEGKGDRCLVGLEEGSCDGSYVAATERGALMCRWLLTGSVSDGSRDCRGARLDGSESNTTEGFYRRGSSD